MTDAQKPVPLLNRFIDFDPIIDKLWGLLEPKIDEQLDKLREQVVALIPVIGAAAAKAISDKFPELVQAILAKDPDLPVVSDIFDLSEMLRGDINNSNVPVQIPGLNVLEDLFKGFRR